ncbi:hypothetical protein DFH09DRAFT_1097776 [Mycena vulgaris]|nr:hypothetical protein DFH09DRAFT_1097776 [Mycena vulgaris]
MYVRDETLIGSSYDHPNSLGLGGSAVRLPSTWVTDRLQTRPGVARGVVVLVVEGTQDARRSRETSIKGTGAGARYFWYFGLFLFFLRGIWIFWEGSAGRVTRVPGDTDTGVSAYLPVVEFVGAVFRYFGILGIGDVFLGWGGGGICRPVDTGDGRAADTDTGSSIIGIGIGAPAQRYYSSNLTNGCGISVFRYFGNRGCIFGLGWGRGIRWPVDAGDGQAADTDTGVCVCACAAKSDIARLGSFCEFGLVAGVMEDERRTESSEGYEGL